MVYEIVISERFPNDLSRMSKKVRNACSNLFCTVEDNLDEEVEDDPIQLSFIGQLLSKLYWAGKGIMAYRDSGAGYENVLTAEVFQLLEFLSRKHFLGVVNSAGKRGFLVCQRCGYSFTSSDGKFPKSHDTHWGKACEGRFSRYSLGYEFTTDILQLWFPDYSNTNTGLWESLLYGLLEGACSALEIDRQDIDGTLYPYKGDRYSPALIIFDDVPGGAGHVRKIAEEENIYAMLQRTLDLTSRCECGGDKANTSCYGCLRNYTNQYCHDELNRGYTAEFVSKLLGQ